MELTRFEEHRYTLDFDPARGTTFVLRFQQPLQQVETPRLAARYDLPGKFNSRGQAAEAGLLAARRLEAGELSAIHEVANSREGDYKIQAGAAFRVDCMRWEPQLRIKSAKPENKGAVQSFNGHDSPLLRMTAETAAMACTLAADHGVRVIRGQTGRLEI